MIALSAFGGFVLTLHVECKLSLALSPVVVCAGLSLILTLAGMLNILYPAVMALYALGWVLLIFEIIRAREKWKKWFCAPILFLVISCLYFGIRLSGLVLLHYDNFSHWALVVDQMLRIDALPSTATPLVIFPSYPVGSATFLYFFARLAGRQESVMAFAQAFWLACCMVPFFLFVRGRKVLGYGLIFGSFLTMLISNVFISELLVDTLLAMTGLSAVTVSLALKNSPRRMLACGIPLMLLMIFIKNSGLFFALLTCGLIFFCWKRQKGLRSALYVLGLLLALLCAFEWIWSLHVRLAFGERIVGKHAISLTVFVENWLQKAESHTTFQAVKNFVHQLIDPHTGISQFYLLMVLALTGLWWFQRDHSAKRATVRNMLWGMVVLVAIWQLSLLGMYLFSATEREALNVSGYQRYSLTMVPYLLGIVLLLQLQTLSDIQKKTTSIRSRVKRAGILACVFFITVTPLWIYRDQIEILWRNINPLQRRANLQAMKEKYELPEGGRYLLYVDHFSETSYAYYIARYLFQSCEVTVANGSSYQTTFTEALPDVDYLLFSDNQPDALAFALDQKASLGLQNVEILTIETGKE